MPAILTLTYTPNYPGNHRVCFRTTQPSYCCYTDDSTSFVGTPKTIEIELEDFELCLQDLPAEVGCAGSVVEGYIQPFCVEQGSDVNRIAFTATFPSNPCTPYKVECTESGVAEIQITDPGSGYGPSEIPAMLISSIYGQDATAEPVMDCVAPSGPCFVANVNITNPGFNYYTPELITITIDPPLGGGTTATAEVIAVDDCGTFTIPNCDGTENTTEYQLIGSSDFINSINVCAGSSGPEAFKYTVTPNPTYDDPAVPVSCCECIKYDVINNCYLEGDIDIYYTDCNQIIQTLSVGQTTATICCVRDSAWPVNKNDNSCIEIVLSATQDC